MPDMTPVGSMYPPVNPISQLSSILGVKQQQQALQTGQYQQDTAQAESQQAQQKNAQLTGAAQLSKAAPDNPRYKDASGNFDTAKLADDISALGPYAQPMAKDLTMRAGEVYKNKQTLFNMESDKRAAVGNMLGALGADPSTDHSKMIDAVESMREQYPNDKEMSRMLTSMSAGMPNTSGPQLQQALRNAAVMVNAPSAAQSQPTNANMDTGGQIQPGVQKPATLGGGFTPAGRPVNKTLAPQVINQPITNAPSVIGGGQGTTPKPVGAGNGWQPKPGESQNVAGMAQNDVGRYSDISKEGTNAQSGAQLADQVSQLASQVRTGKLTKEWADRLAILRQNDPSVTDRQMLSKYAAQLKTLAHDGASTDASRGQVDEGMPSPETMDPDAVKQAAQYVGGIFRMRGARQAYADQYAKNTGGALGIQGADDSFMRSADPTLFAYKALPAGPERQEFLKNHGLTTAEKQQSFKARMNQIDHYSGGQ